VTQIGGPKPSVLTIDDDPIILNLVFSALKDEYLVRPFTSGPAALEYLKNNSADLILLDHNMPEMTGFEVLTALRDDPNTRDIPVIYLTGSVNSEDEITALELGAADYLLKPFRPRALTTRVRMQIELARHRNHLEELVAEKTQELSEANKKLILRDRITLDMLAQASDLRDHDTALHLERTTAYTKIIVDDLLETPTEGYIVTPEYGSDIIDAVKLHDLGKLAMPDAVLLKPGRLTEDEFAIIKTHPTYGHDMLQNAMDKMDADTLLGTALDIAFSHHEKWNGSGYPQGLKGLDIPLSARIAAISDVFDALTSERPYKRAFTPREAFDIMYKDSGTHFDPYLIDVVKRHETAFTEVSETLRDARLSDN